MSLDPQTTLEPDGRVRMTWTPDLTGLGYRFYRDAVPVSIGTKPDQSSTRFAAETDGKPHAYGLRALDVRGVLEQSFYPPVTDPPPTDGPIPPPPFPGFNASRTVVADTLTEWFAAIAGLRAGDHVDGRGLNFTNPQQGFELRGVRPSGPVLLTFDPACKMSRQNSHGAIVTHCANLYMQGGRDITSTGFSGLYVDDCQNVVWHGWRVHDPVRFGVLVTSASGMNDGVDLYGDIEDSALTPYGSGLQEPGSDNHACYWGATYAANPAGLTRNSKIALNVRRWKFGHALQLGDHAVGGTVDLYVEDQGTGKDGSVYRAQVQSAGNALCPYSQNNHPVSDFVIRRIIGKRLQGAMVDARWLNSPSGRNVVKYGRGYQTNLNPAAINQAGRYVTDNPYITFEDCQ